MPYNIDTKNWEPVWEETGPGWDTKQRLNAHIRVAGADMHLEAIEVWRDDDGFNIPKWEIYENTLESLEDMNECTFQTVEIGGRNYVLIATPFGV